MIQTIKIDYIQLEHPIDYTIHHGDMFYPKAVVCKTDRFAHCLTGRPFCYNWEYVLRVSNMSCRGRKMLYLSVQLLEIYRRSVAGNPAYCDCMTSFRFSHTRKFWHWVLYFGYWKKKCKTEYVGAPLNLFQWLWEFYINDD